MTVYNKNKKMQTKDIKEFIDINDLLRLSGIGSLTENDVDEIVQDETYQNDLEVKEISPFNFKTETLIKNILHDIIIFMNDENILDKKYSKYYINKIKEHLKEIKNDLDELKDDEK